MLVLQFRRKGGPNLQQKDWSHRRCHERDKAGDETRLSCCIEQETPEAQKGEVEEVHGHVPGEAGAGDEDLEAARACHAVGEGEGEGEEDEDGQDDEVPLGDEEDESPFPVRGAGEEEDVADDDPRSLLVP